MSDIPVVLFAYARPDNLERTLDCLRMNRVPKIYAFSDGARSEADASDVRTVREMLRRVDWCDISITERPVNLGLGKSILSGVTEILAKHDSVIVFEDDLVCVPGTYQYLSAALEAYRDDNRVMSVTGWTHPLVTPKGVGEGPYFDGRAECWVWGTWSRAWNGMTIDAKTLMEEARAKGIDVYRYGSDLVEMAEAEIARNIWAVRFLYLHILLGGLCLRPPWSMVEHIGFDSRATNAREESWLRNPPLRPSPLTPKEWPEPRENQDCARLHRMAAGDTVVRRERMIGRVARRVVRRIRRTVQRDEGSSSLLQVAGNYDTWQAAQRATTGYSSEEILRKTRDALLQVKTGDAAYERDSVLFDDVEYSWPVLSGLMWVAAEYGSLNVMDVGGSLGSTFFQNRQFIDVLPKVRWNVIEQIEHVRVGKRDFESDRLKFFSSIEECVAETRPNVVLLSSVLQYFETPYDTVAKIEQLPIDRVIIDRTPFWQGINDRLCIQRVPPEIYNATYPIWVFSHQKFHDKVQEAWNVVAEFDSLDRLSNALNAAWRGMILKRKNEAT